MKQKMNGKDGIAFAHIFWFVIAFFLIGMFAFFSVVAGGEGKRLRQTEHDWECLKLGEVAFYGHQSGAIGQGFEPTKPTMTDITAWETMRGSKKTAWGAAAFAVLEKVREVDRKDEFRKVHPGDFWKYSNPQKFLLIVEIIEGPSPDGKYSARVVDAAGKPKDEPTRVWRENRPQFLVTPDELYFGPIKE